jgi:hypothetical protein
MSYPIIKLDVINYADGEKLAELKVSSLPPINTCFYIEHLNKYYQVKNYFLNTIPTNKEGSYKEGDYKMIVISGGMRTQWEETCKNI